MPVWNSEPGAANRWRLSVVVEDKQGQRVSSNEIALGADRAAGQVYHAEASPGRTRLRRFAPGGPIPPLPRGI